MAIGTEVFLKTPFIYEIRALLTEPLLGYFPLRRPNLKLALSSVPIAIWIGLPTSLIPIEKGNKKTLWFLKEFFIEIK